MLFQWINYESKECFFCLTFLSFLFFLLLLLWFFSFKFFWFVCLFLLFTFRIGTNSLWNLIFTDNWTCVFLCLLLVLFIKVLAWIDRQTNKQTTTKEKKMIQSEINEDLGMTNFQTRVGGESLLIWIKHNNSKYSNRWIFDLQSAKC